MRKIERMAAAEFRKLSKKRQREINALKRIAVAPAGRRIDSKRQKEINRRWRWDGAVS